MSVHCVWNLWNEFSASFINFIWNNHKCKTLCIMWLLNCMFNIALSWMAWWCYGPVIKCYVSVVISFLWHMMLSTEYEQRHMIKGNRDRYWHSPIWNFRTVTILTDWSLLWKFQADLPSLEDLLFVGNPLEEALQSTEKGYRDTVQEKLLRLKKLDGAYSQHNCGGVLLFHIGHLFVCLSIVCLSVWVAQLDAHLTGDQDVAGSTPAKVGNILFVEIDHEIFSAVILSLPLIQEGQLSVSGKRMCTILVNCLED